MSHATNPKINLPSWKGAILITFCTALLSLIISGVAAAHGGKHQDDKLTRFQAVQKAVDLYDQLIAQGKLEPGWETELEEIEVNTRMKENRREMIVSFHRDHGEPDTVYIFFDENGNYAGSNFTGQ